MKYINILSNYKVFYDKLNTNYIVRKTPKYIVKSRVTKTSIKKSL